MSELPAEDAVCVCDHTASEHSHRQGVLACDVAGCACGPGCIHTGFVDRETGVAAPMTPEAQAREQALVDHDPEVSVHMCGPQSAKCSCKCPDGPCEHVWDGPEEVFDDGRGSSATCSRCKMTAMAHDMWVCP